MKSIAYQVATYISDNSLGSFTPDEVGGNIYLDTLPEDANTISVFNTQGVPTGLLSHRTLGIQILYRGDTNPIESYEKADEIFRLVNRSKGFFMKNGNYVVNCYSPNGSGAERLGTDENGNFEYTMNFLITFSLNKED